MKARTSIKHKNGFTVLLNESKNTKEGQASLDFSREGVYGIFYGEPPNFKRHTMINELWQNRRESSVLMTQQ